MFYQLPPVGSPVTLAREAGDRAFLEALISPYTADFYQSGTAALAAALVAARQLRAVEHPEVILPAYACPDLVSAVVHAGARPVLVDLESDRPWIDPDALRDRLGANTVAVIAVHLFGIPERVAALRAITDPAGVPLIEDSAQAFPGGGERPFWSADLVVLSFGRGKPVSALGGGAVLSREVRLRELLPEASPAAPGGWLERVKIQIKTNIYNLLINPHWYWLPNSLPFLHLGETHYRPLSAICTADPQTVGRIAANARLYRSQPYAIQSELTSAMNSLVDADPGLIDLPTACGQSATRRLLRYPLLVDENRRDACLAALNARGLGATHMYPSSLSTFPGLVNLFQNQGEWPQAKRFARRIVTLPVHPGVRSRDVEAMTEVLAQRCGN